MATAAMPALHVPLDLPLDWLAATIGGMARPSLLIGGPGFGEAGRWSILTAQPVIVFEFDGRSWTETRSDGTSLSGVGDPLDAFRHRLDATCPGDPCAAAPEPGRSPFQGGWIGYFGYDIAPLLERVPRKAHPDSKLPVFRFALYDWAVAIDHASGTATLSVFEVGGEPPRASRLKEIRKALARGSTHVRASRPAESGVSLRSLVTRDEYLAAVERSLEYIRAGDIFQVNLSQRFEGWGEWDPLSLSRRLRKVSPAPYSAFLQWGDCAVVSSSPELFYQSRGDQLVTRPIKGTRPRGATKAEDDRLADELRHSAKDRAELTMIVDLERNDLGRVCRYGTVRVTDPLVVESYAQVHHLVATVEGRLRPLCGPIDVVRAMHPGGSITGAPKIRAMEIIDELEPRRRGVYTGAIGYFTAGASAFNIAIRTLLIEGNRVSYQVGGAIVADSVPELEYEETLHKARGMRAVLEGAGA